MTNPELLVKRNKDGVLEDEIGNIASPAKMFVAAKEYFNDYIYENLIDIENVRGISDRDRKLVKDFIKDPVKVFCEKYRDKANSIFITEKGESLAQYRVTAAQEWRRIHGHEIPEFVQRFNTKNNKPNGYNVGKDIARILRDNKGGIYERLVDSHLLNINH